jgi:hypothetical protein
MVETGSDVRLVIGDRALLPVDAPRPDTTESQEQSPETRTR